MTALPPPLSAFEASHVVVQALPGAVVIELVRNLPSERVKPRRMMIELSTSEALAHWKRLGEELRRAGAMEGQTIGADASPSL